MYRQTLNDNVYSQGYETMAYSGKTVFAQQMICIAKYLYSKNLRDSNYKNNEINKFMVDYYGNPDGTVRDTLDAYCAMFAFYVVNEAARALGCAHYFPTQTASKKKFANIAISSRPEIWGKAIATLDGVKAERRVKVDTIS